MAHRVKRLVETKVVVEPGYQPPHRDDAARTKWLKNWANELAAFFRDHRQMDVNSVNLEHVYEDVCSKCEREIEIEVYDEPGEDGLPHCSWCGAVIEGDMVAAK